MTDRRNLIEPEAAARLEGVLGPVRAGTADPSVPTTRRASAPTPEGAT